MQKRKQFALLGLAALLFAGCSSAAKDEEKAEEQDKTEEEVDAAVDTDDTAEDEATGTGYLAADKTEEDGTEESFVFEYDESSQEVTKGTVELTMPYTLYGDDAETVKMDLENQGADSSVLESIAADLGVKAADLETIFEDETFTVKAELDDHDKIITALGLADDASFELNSFETDLEALGYTLTK
jgi:PBP1b-binding outer membrane lipoprotein LpoB